MLNRAGCVKFYPVQFSSLFTSLYVLQEQMVGEGGRGGGVVG
jgi:hypothetical protein